MRADLGLRPADPRRVGTRAPDDTHAVTRDPLGANLPPLETAEDWVFAREFALGVREVTPINIAPEPVLRGS